MIKTQSSRASDWEWIDLFTFQTLENETAGRRLVRYLGISPDEAEERIRRVLHRQKVLNQKVLIRSDGP